MRIACIDVETTGLDPSTDEIVEIAAVVYDDALERRPFYRKGSVVLRPSTWNDETAVVHGIPKAVAEKYAEAKGSVAQVLGISESDVDGVCAYNAAFDKPFVTKLVPHLGDIPWLCGMEGVPHVEVLKRPPPQRSLTAMALAYGITVVPAMLHRALYDAELLYQIMANHSFERVVSLERLLLTLRGSYDSTGTMQAKAKQDGFVWNPNDRTWTRTALRTTGFDAEFEAMRQRYAVGGWSLTARTA